MLKRILPAVGVIVESTRALIGPATVVEKGNVSHSIAVRPMISESSPEPRIVPASGSNIAQI